MSTAQDTAQDSETRAAITLSTIGTWLSLAAAVTLPLYAVGYVALAAQIAAAHTADFSTAFYAASLVPDKVILGQGLRAFWTEPLLVLTFLISVVVWNTDRRPLPFDFVRAALTGFERQHYKRRSLWRFRIGLAAFVALLILPEVFLGGPSVSLAPSVTGFLLGYVIVWGRQLGFPRISYHLAAIMLIAVGMIAHLVLLADLEEPPLPQVVLQRDGGAASVSGRLVAHSHGYWHVLTGNQLLSVRDADVTTAATSP